MPAKPKFRYPLAPVVTPLFMDSEFTGLRQDTTLLSLALIGPDCFFYAEFTDYDPAQITDWLRENVLAHLRFNDREPSCRAFNETDSPHEGLSMEVRGASAQVAIHLKRWLVQFDKVQIWSDVLAYDWVLFNGLLADFSAGYPLLPANVSYIPMDLATFFQVKGIDPDISREGFAGYENSLNSSKHNALHDARVIRACHQKLLSL